MDYEKLFYINDGLRIVVRRQGADTYVIIESAGKTITLDLEKWKKFQKWYPIVNTEFNLRLQNTDDTQ